MAEIWRTLLNDGSTVLRIEAENKLAHLQTRIDFLTKALKEYGEHQSWRCEHPPHFYFATEGVVSEGNCACDLLNTLKIAGISGESREEDNDA